MASSSSSIPFVCNYCGGSIGQHSAIYVNSQCKHPFHIWCDSCFGKIQTHAHCPCKLCKKQLCRDTMYPLPGDPFLRVQNVSTDALYMLCGFAPQIIDLIAKKAREFWEQQQMFKYQRLKMLLAQTNKKLCAQQQTHVAQQQQLTHKNEQYKQYAVQYKTAATKYKQKAMQLQQSLVEKSREFKAMTDQYRTLLKEAKKMSSTQPQHQQHQQHAATSSVFQSSSFPHHHPQQKQLQPPSYHHNRHSSRFATQNSRRPSPQHKQSNNNNSMALLPSIPRKRSPQRSTASSCSSHPQHSHPRTPTMIDDDGASFISAITGQISTTHHTPRHSTRDEFRPSSDSPFYAAFNTT